MTNKKTRFVAGLLVCMMLCSMLALMCSAKETAVTYGKIAVDAGANVRSRAVDGTIYFTAPKAMASTGHSAISTRIKVLRSIFPQRIPLGMSAVICIY